MRFGNSGGKQRHRKGFCKPQYHGITTADKTHSDGSFSCIYYGCHCLPSCDFSAKSDYPAQQENGNTVTFLAGNLLSTEVVSDAVAPAVGRPRPSRHPDLLRTMLTIRNNSLFILNLRIVQKHPGSRKEQKTDNELTSLFRRCQFCF